MYDIKLDGCTVLECGVDWVTATVHNGGEQRALARLAENWALDRSCEGYRLSGWKWNNYQGSQTDGISFGQRDDGFIVRLSGSMAGRHWQEALTWAHNVTRFDIQTTLLASNLEDEHAWTHYTQLASDPRITSGSVRARYIEDTPTGSTLYVGSRASDRMFRCYDKTAESDGEYPERSWRYEIEYKGDRAWRVASAIKALPHTTQAIFDCLVTAFDTYHVRIPANKPAWSWRDAGVRHQTDDERRLAWLSRCIRPCVVRLTEAFGVDEVLTRLGFYEEVDELTGEVEVAIHRDLIDSVT